jgi:tRNA (guanine-N7-)-methyltransferase
VRQRKIKNLDQKIEALSHLIAENPQENKGHWRQAFSDGKKLWLEGRNDTEPQRSGVIAGAKGVIAGLTRNPLASSKNLQPDSMRELFLELGCGKGMFISGLSRKNPDSLYLAAEGQDSVFYKALDRVASSGDSPDNLLFLRTFVFHLNDFFSAGELDGVYLNFSDPWPKAKHEKRRLTSPTFLAGYRHALKTGGFLQFKTDNAPLFDYSVRTVAEDEGFEIVRLTQDLHRSEYAEDNTMTEYEKKFINFEREIKYLLAVKR